MQCQHVTLSLTDTGRAAFAGWRMKQAQELPRMERMVFAFDTSALAFLGTVCEVTAQHRCSFTKLEC